MPWGIGGADIPEPPDPGSNLGAGISISKLLGKGISGRVYYVYRRELEDLGMHDDFLDMSFNPEKVDYKQLVCEVLPTIIIAFNAYFVEVGDTEFCHVDFDAESAAGGDSRSRVYRIRPVFFLDNILCDRAFGLQPDVIARRIENYVEKVMFINNGIYTVANSQPLRFEEADKLCWELKRMITGTITSH